MANDKQHTLVWHADDVKASHIDPEVNNGFAQFIKDKCEDTGKVKTIHGKVHDHLGVNLDLIKKGVIAMDMTDCLQSMFDDFSADLKTTAASPAADHLFQVRETTKPDKARAEEFHNVTARGFFTCKRARQDIQQAISFLCTRVRELDLDDWGKSCHMMKHLKGTQCLKLK